MTKFWVLSLFTRLQWTGSRKNIQQKCKMGVFRLLPFKRRMMRLLWVLRRFFASYRRAALLLVLLVFIVMIISRMRSKSSPIYVVEEHYEGIQFSMSFFIPLLCINLDLFLSSWETFPMLSFDGETDVNLIIIVIIIKPINKINAFKFCRCQHNLPHSW